MTGQGSQVYAAIDLGTNNCRLLIAIPKKETFHVICSFSRIIRLGEDLKTSGKLSEAAIKRAIKVLSVCQNLMSSNGVTIYQAIATEACRRAQNSLDFVSRVYAKTSINIDIITPYTEAALTFNACHCLLDQNSKYDLIFDIGGGSTELILVSQNKDKEKTLDKVYSIPDGVVTLFDEFGDNLQDDATYSAIISKVNSWLEKFEFELEKKNISFLKDVTLIGTSGTMTILGAFHLGLKYYDRSRVDGMIIDRSSIKILTKLLINMSRSARAAHPCIGPLRADLVVMGCAILDAISMRWPKSHIRVADRGPRDGLLLNMMQPDGNFQLPIGCNKQISLNRINPGDTKVK